MNFAFQAFLLLLFYLPGALFLSAVFGRLSEDQELPVISSLTSRAAAALVAAVVFHAFWVTLIWLLSLAPDRFMAVFPGGPVAAFPEKYFALLSTGQQSAAYDAASTWVGANLGHGVVYFLSICFAAGVTGHALHRWIARNHLDLKHSWLRLKPQWHYVLSGEEYRFRYGIRGKITVLADILVELNKEAVLYSGVVTKYWFEEKTGRLDAVFLEGVERLSPLPAVGLTSPLAAQVGAVSIPGDTFLLKFSDVKNINLHYVTLGANVQPDGNPSDKPAPDTLAAPQSV